MAENTKKWEEAGRHYRTYIKLEKRLAQNTVEAYMRDLRSFAHFILRMYDVPPAKVEEPMVQRYVAWLYDRGPGKGLAGPVAERREELLQLPAHQRPHRKFPGPNSS